jgi:SagB-type dehydrogenase family enzyme
MSNLNLESAWKYHNSTKHSWESVRTNPHFLDWANQPRLYKVYRDPESFSLPEDRQPTGRATLSVIQENGCSAPHDAAVSLPDLADVLYFAAGITRRRMSSGGEFLFRAAACTGALYSIELYAVSREVQGLEAGVYLFSPIDLSLKLLLRGDYSGALVRATAGESSISRAPVTVICTGTYWRNAWKYQARTYRHFGWDNGTILANLLAGAAAKSLPARVVNGFVDEDVNSLLGLDTDREVALNLVPLGYSGTPSPPFTGAVPALRLDSLPYSPSEVDYPSMREMHSASCLGTTEEVLAWRAPSGAGPLSASPGKFIPLNAFGDEEAADDSIEQVILRRGSSRRFRRSTISFRQLSTILHTATRGVPADFISPCGAQLNDVYLVAHAVEGLEPGAYVLHRNPWGLELLKRGDFRKITGRLGLDQDLPADCSAAVFFLADLNRILNRLGNRGYRAAQLDAGIIGGRLYLAAYAQRLGATGLTFYDDEVTEFFSPHASGKSAIFLVALGQSEKVRLFR